LVNRQQGDRFALAATIDPRLDRPSRELTRVNLELSTIDVRALSLMDRQGTIRSATATTQPKGSQRHRETQSNT
jgi:hypothetical protein